MSALEGLGLHRRGWVLWCLLRCQGVVSLWLFGLVGGDLYLYAGWARAWAAGASPYVDFDVEYPPGMLLLLRLPVGSDLQYVAAFVGLALVADATVLWLLRRDGRAAGATLWLVLPLLLGPVTWCRADIFVALALVAGVDAARRGRPEAAALCLVGAASLKLWPAALLVLALPVLAPAHRWRFLVTGALSGTALVTAVAAGGGLPGLRWMLAYHADRGLQVESLPAVGAHLLRLLGADLPVAYAFGSLEFAAADVPLVLTACTAALVLGLAACGLVAAAPSRRGTAELAPVVLALTLAVAVSSKVLSAQYAVWIVAAVAVAVDGLAPRRRLMAASATLLLTTQYVFPFTFGGIREGSAWALCALLAHGAALLWLCLTGLRALWQPVRAPARRPADAALASSR